MAFQPADRTKPEHIGQLDRIVWSDLERPMVIMRLTDGASVLGSAMPDQFTTGQRYRFHGRWKDGKFGPEFHFSTFTHDEPHTQHGVVRYLAKTCSFVGEVTARRLWEKFGADAVKVLREQPDRVADAGVLSPDQAKKAAADLERFKNLEDTRISLLDLFDGRGFPGRVIERAISFWGVAAPDVIRRNPFSLLVRKLPGCGFKRCDKLYLDLKRPVASLKRQALCAWSVIREDRTGSTWIDASNVAMAVADIIPGADPYRALVLLRRAGWIRVRRIEQPSQRFVALRDRADAEQRIADNVRRLSRHPSLWPTHVLTTQVDGDGLPSPHQGEELQLATAKAVGCFVGGPGTGKTHSLSFLLKQAITEHGEQAVAVVAPTGKAAVRAGESLRARGIGIHATTIHRLLEIGRNGHDGDGWGFERNRESPINERLIVVDESSMIDTTLMADLLDAIPNGGSVLFVGDQFQLPPVGHGAPLRDLIAAGIPTGELTEVRRNAGAIVRGCAAIKAGSPVRFAEKLELDADDPANLRLVDVGQSEMVDTLGDVLAAIDSKGFDPAWECQVITPLNDKSDASRIKLNERFGKLLNPNGYSTPKNPFRVGDKIICLRNTRLKAVRPYGKPDPATIRIADSYSETGEEVYTANGEIGRVVAIGEKATVARFGGEDSSLVKIANTKKKQAQEEGDSAEAGAAVDFDLAWAITVHRSQGSEWPCVIVMVDDAGSQIADRNFWYTAISRARKCCIVIGPRGVFERQAKRIAIQRRRTFLADILKTEQDAEDAENARLENARECGRLAEKAAEHRSELLHEPPDMDGDE